MATKKPAKKKAAKPVKKTAPVKTKNSSSRVKQPVGRPTDYSENLSYRICELIASGQPLVKICRTEDMPHVATVYRWLDANKEFRDRYARAREDQADTLADEIIAIADESVIGEKVKTSDDGKTEITTGDMVERSRLRVDARKWVAAKLKPKKYGDKIEHSGNPDAPMTVSVVNFASMHKPKS